MKNRTMKLFCILVFTGLSSAIVQTGCKPLTPEVKQDILNGQKVACALANVFLNDPQIAALCNIADNELGPIMDLVSMQRVALAKSRAVGVTEGATRAGNCSPVPDQTGLDAGTVVPKDAAKDAK